MIVMDFLIIIGSLFSAIPNTVIFGIGRFISGFSIGICLGITPLYVGETTPQVMMRKIGPFISFMITFGVTTSYAFGLLLPTNNFQQPLNALWHFNMAFPGILALYQAIFFIFFVQYDSPQYYLQINDLQLYEKALSEIYDLESTKRELHKYLEDPGSALSRKSTKSSRITYKELIFSKEYRKMLRIGIILGSIQQLSGINSIIFYSSTIFQQIGNGIFLSRLLTFFLGLTQMVANVFTILFMRYFGRKKILTSGYILLTIDLLVIGLTNLYLQQNTIIPAVLLCIYLFIFAYSLSATTWSYFGEILNQKCMTIAITCNYLINICVVLAFPYASDSFGLASVFCFYAVFMAIGAVYCSIDMIETKNKTREEIELNVHSHSNMSLDYNENNY